MARRLAGGARPGDRVDVDHSVMTSHDAAPSALGYLFQTKWPLIALLQRAKLQPDCELVLEVGDDVVWMSDGTPEELVQTKHHISRTSSLTDMSPDIWRTIAVWLDFGPPADADGPSFVLVTTAVTVTDSAAAKLGSLDRDPAGAAGLLAEAAASSTSQATEDVRRRFLALNDAERLAFVSRITVLGGEPHIDDLDAALVGELYWALPGGHETLFVGLVWDWWLRQAIGLLNRSVSGVSGLAVRAAIDDLRDKFSDDNLPTLVQREAFDATTTDEYLERVFVQQLDLVDPPKLILERAIQDYFRAYTQSALWIENNLVGMVEIDRFEADLRDEWEREFAWMTNRLAPDASEEDKRAAGRELLQRCLDSTRIQLRENYRDPFFVRGKLHHLADQRRAGWHPDFEAAIEALLLGASGE